MELAKKIYNRLELQKINNIILHMEQKEKCARREGLKEFSMLGCKNVKHIIREICIEKGWYCDCGFDGDYILVAIGGK